MGILGGFLRGITELLTVRAMDVILCFPPLLLALLVVTLLGPGAATLILVLSVLYLPGFARIAYAGVLQARAQDYVEAVRVLGASRPRIMLRTILPNVLGPVLVQVSLTCAAAIVLESGLSFLGLGVVPPAPSWGLMIRGARATMDQAPLLLLWPCAALTLTILAINALCDALQRHLDPRSAATPPPRHRPHPARPSPARHAPRARRPGPHRRDRHPGRPHPPRPRRHAPRRPGRDPCHRRRKRLRQVPHRPRHPGPAAARRPRHRRVGAGRRPGHAAPA